MIFIKIAWNNLLRNYRRTVSTLVAILVGVGVIVFINGFNDGLTTEFNHAFINGSNGHFRLRHVEYSDYVSTDMEKILMKDPQRLKNEMKKNPHVVASIMRIPMGGLAGNENKSTSFFGSAVETDQLYTVLPLFNRTLVAGEKLEAGDPMGAVLGKALAESIDVKIGDELVIVSNSIYAEQNAILIYVKGLIEIPGSLETEQNLIVTSTDQVQNDLLDLNSGATDLLVRIDDEKHLESVVEWVNSHFADRGEPWVAIPWYDAPGIGQGMVWLRGIATIISLILSLLVGIIISNALLMSVFERIREIGAIRAVGTEKWQVYKIFYGEAMITILFGVLLGLAAGALATWLAGIIGFSVPGFAHGLEVHPAVELKSLLKAAVIPIVFAALAVLFPIRSSCKMDIVDALNYR